MRSSCGLLILRGQFHREFDRGDHAVGARDSFAGDFERGSVIRTRARKWQAQRHIHALVKGVELQRNQSLIVIHAEHCIPFAFAGVMKNRVGRKWAGERW